MKKILFLLIIFVSSLKVGEAAHISLYAHEYPSKTNIECIYNPDKNNVIFYFNSTPFHKETAKNLNSNKNLLLVNKFSLLYFNIYIAQQLKLNRHCFTFHFQFLKIPQGIHSYSSSYEDPFQLS